MRSQELSPTRSIDSLPELNERGPVVSVPTELAASPGATMQDTITLPAIVQDAAQRGGRNEDGARLGGRPVDEERAGKGRVAAEFVGGSQRQRAGHDAGDRHGTTGDQKRQRLGEGHRLRILSRQHQDVAAGLDRLAPPESRRTR
jgi:hypothetical protein